MLVLCSLLTVQFHIAHLYEIQVSWWFAYNIYIRTENNYILISYGLIHLFSGSLNVEIFLLKSSFFCHFIFLILLIFVELHVIDLFFFWVLKAAFLLLFQNSPVLVGSCWRNPPDPSDQQLVEQEYLQKNLKEQLESQKNVIY